MNDYLSMKIIKKVPLDPHRCMRPGWLTRRRLGLGFGSVIECECGKRYKLMDYEGAYWSELRDWEE